VAFTAFKLLPAERGKDRIIALGPRLRNGAALDQVIHGLGNVGGVIPYALDVLGTKQQVDARCDIARVFQHVGQELAKDRNAQRVDLLVAPPYRKRLFQIARGIAVEHLLELCQDYGAHVLHAAAHPQRVRLPFQQRRTLGDVLGEIPDAFQIVAQPQRADELAQINRHRLPPRNRQYRLILDLALKRDGDSVILIGDTGGHLGASLYLREIEGREAGPPPPVDFSAERRNGDFVRAMIQGGFVAACHDLSDGGLLVALAEMAMAGMRGITLDPIPTGLPKHAYLFGEDQARYLIEVEDPQAVLNVARAAGVPARAIGVVGGASLTLHGSGAISVATLKAINEAWLPGYMAQA